MHLDQPGYSYINMEQRISPVVGHNYVFSFFWKAEKLPDNSRCTIFAGYNYENFYHQAEVNFDSTSASGYTIYSIPFTAQHDNPAMSIWIYCETNHLYDEGIVLIDDASVISLDGCEAYPSTNSFIENPSMEIQATEDSTYAWFGTNGVTMKARSSVASDPQPREGDNFMLVARTLLIAFGAEF